MEFDVHRLLLFRLASLAICLLGLQSAFAQESSLEDKDAPVALLRKYCFDCHANGSSEGNLELENLLAETSSLQSRANWWKVLSNLRAATMPPPASDIRLTRDEIQTLSNWLKFQRLGIDKTQPDPGRVTLRRLNRREYANTIRDLLGIDFNADIVFPPDDTGFGFDNVGDALSLSPMVVEKFLSAASQIVDEAIPKTNYEIVEQKFRASDIRSAEGRNSDNMRMDRGLKTQLEFQLPHDGIYQLELVMKSGGSFEFSAQRCTLQCELDGQQLFQHEYSWDESKRDRKLFTINWKAGSHRLNFELTPLALAEKAKDDSFSDLDIEAVIIRGPEDQQYWRHPKGYDRIFTRDKAPDDIAGRREYAREILSRFGERAFRRPVDRAALDRLITIYEQFLQQPNTTFEAAVARTIVPMLASPRFLFRTEAASAADVAQTFPLIDEYALASRLSYFLWSSMPDEALFELARTGKLRENLEPTVARMLKDSKARSLSKNFVGQWLRTRDVEKISIDPIAVYGLQKEYEELLNVIRRNRFGGRRASQNPDAASDPELEKKRARFQELRQIQGMWDADIRVAMRRESEMLFEYIAHENRDLAEIIEPGYTFLNERLANHYGIKDVRGGEMRRVELPPDSVRGGILTQGTMLTVTSNPTRTSPVKRGLYILENILGTPTPPAPPNVPTLEDTSSKFGDRQPSLKELLAVHRDSPLCSSCHSRMDPLGIALENFDALGVWRESEHSQPIDASGQLITGEAFRDFRDLRRIITHERREDFYRCVSQKMLVYALGRGIDYYDEYTLDILVERLISNRGRFEELIYGIVESAPFQRQRQPNSVASN